MCRAEAVHANPPSAADRELWERAAVAAARYTDTSVDLAPGGPGATYSISLVPGLTDEDGTPAAASISPFTLPGGAEIKGGEISFEPAFLNDYTTVVKELVRATGATGGDSPFPGLLSDSAVQAEPTPEEQFALRAAKNVPLGALCVREDGVTPCK